MFLVSLKSARTFFFPQDKRLTDGSSFEWPRADYD